MSWDVGVRVKSGPESYISTEDYNYTYNCGAMFQAACGRGLSESLHETPCPEAKGLLEFVIGELIRDPIKYNKLNPTNGWGNRVTFVEFLTNVKRLCEEHPYGEVYVL